MPYFFFFSFETIFSKVAFFLFMYHGDIRLRSLTRLVLAIIFISMWQTHAQQQNITFCWKKYVVLCHSYVLHCDWSCDKKNSAIFWSSCLNLNVWLFPSGIEFISFLKKNSEKAVFIVICETIIWSQSENRIK